MPVALEGKWNIKHLAYQAFCLVFYAGYMPVLLFLPLYLKYNGLSTVQIGLLTGLRPLLQSIGAPILVKLSTKFHVKKLLFVVSCILMIGKFFVVFIVLRPEKQLCRTMYRTGEVKDTNIYHELIKRADVMDEWTHELNSTASDVSFVRYDTAENTVQWSYLNPTVIQPENVFHGFNDTQSRTRPKQSRKIQYRINNKDDVHFIFITVLGLTLVTDYFDATIIILVDSAYRSSAVYKGVWVWGDIAWGVMTLVIGVTMNQTAQEICGRMIGSFHYVFYFFVAFETIAMFIGSRLDLTVDLYVADVTRRVQTSKWNFQYNIFLLAYTLTGFCNGFLFSFLYWFIDTLGGDPMIMGLSTSVECLASVVVFKLLEHVIEHIGHLSAICVGFLGYIGLFFSYYCLKNPWLVLSVKVLQASVSGLMVYTCNSFLKSAAPAGSSYQMQETLHAIYLAIGTAIGAVFSGFTLNNYRFRMTFLWFAFITCIVSFLFLGVQLLLVCTEKRNGSAFASEFSSSDGSEFGDDENDMGSGYEEEKSW